MNKEELLVAIHKVYRRDKYIQDLFQSIGISLDEVQLYLEDIEKQLQIDTATWGLGITERDMGIVPEDGSSYEDRRSAIIARNRTNEKLTLDVLKNIALSWANGDIDVTFTGGKINITFASKTGIPKDINSFYAAIENAKPAHLAAIYTIIYNRWQDAKKLRWDDVKNRTWDSLRNDTL